MATRGHLGGLARTTADAALVLDAAGFDPIIIETVGVGQDEVDIARTADLSLVVLMPGAGDEIQALKAGVLEIADVFVVNKGDREGAGHLVATLEAALALRQVRQDEWRPPIVTTVATTGAGVTELAGCISRFRESAARGAGTAERRVRQRKRSEEQFREIVVGRLAGYLQRETLEEGEYAAIVDEIAARSVDPHTAADRLLARLIPPVSRPAVRSRRS
jgi:LAO/AO transport system kinase